MQETISLEAYTGNNAYGPVYGSAVTYSPATGTGVYVEPGFRTVTNRMGKEVISSALLIAPSTQIYNAQDRVTWAGQTYLVIDAQPLRPLGSVHHQEVYLQSVGG